MDVTVQAARENFVYITLIAAGIGLLLGLIPLVVALRKGRTRLGLLANLVRTVVGAVNPVLALIAAAIFTWVVMRKSPAATTDGTKSTTGPTQTE